MRTELYPAEVQTIKGLLITALRLFYGMSRRSSEQVRDFNEARDSLSFPRNREFQDGEAPAIATGSLAGEKLTR
jgi:hypothetical protein